MAKRKVRSAAQVAGDAAAAAASPAHGGSREEVAATIGGKLAAQLLAMNERIKDLDQRVTTTFRAHPQAEIIESLPRMGPILGAELIAAAGDLNAPAVVRTDPPRGPVRHHDAGAAVGRVT